MADELQPLLDRIQKEGVDKAQADSDRIVTAARARADQIVRDAEQKATTRLETARKDADILAERSIKAIGQASRDLTLAIGDAINATIRNLLETEVATALTPETLGQMLVAVLTAYTRTPADRADIEILLPPDQQQAVLALMHARFADKLREGISIKGDTSVLSGFRAVLKDQNVEHDFTAEAITDALAKILRPHMAEVLRESIKRIDSVR
jgi:V/A-type H+-transporting ATPase subunit E